jgi:hypothetical protein
MVREDHSTNATAQRKRYFKWVTLGMAGYRTKDGQTSLFIIGPRGKHNCRPPSCLFTASLRREVQPDNVAGIRHILGGYHSSFPTGSPQSVSKCRFSGVIPDTNSSRVGVRFGFRILTFPGPSTSTSRSSPILSFAAKATGFGIRTAKLFPHFASCVFIAPLVSTEYILCGPSLQGQIRRWETAACCPGSETALVWEAIDRVRSRYLRSVARARTKGNFWRAVCVP